MSYTPGLYHQEESIAATLYDLGRAHRILEMEGHGDMSMGHLSYRDPFGRGLWLKRGNLALSEVEGDDFILIDYDGNVLEGQGLRHLEWPLHAEILKARPDVNFVGHSHSDAATLVGATSGVIQPLNNHGVWFGSEGVPLYRATSHIITTVELGVDVAKQLGEADAILLSNHGVAFVGTDVMQVTLAGVFLEWAAQFQLKAHATGLELHVPDLQETDEKKARIYPAKAQRNYWMYFNRKLEQLEQGN